MTDTYGYPQTNRDYWDQQYPGIFKPVPKVQQSLAQPTPRKAKPAPTPLRKPERAGDVICIWLPLPHAQLHKNGSKSKNRGWVASLIRSAKNAAHFAAWIVRFPEPPKAVRIDLTFYMTRRRDDDGLIHWCVPYRDGIASALGCNDGNFTTGDVRQVTGKAAGDRREVELVLTKIE